MNNEKGRIGPVGSTNGSAWFDMATAPKDGTRIKARERYVHHYGKYHPVYRWRTRTTWWGKASHVPLYGWCHGRDVEDIDLWQPTQWRTLPNTQVSRTAGK